MSADAVVGEAAPAKPPTTELGEEHNLLKLTCGKWKVDCTFIMDGEESKCTSDNVIREMVIGGRFMRETFKMDFMGEPYHGEQIVGFYDGCFQATYIDTMGNGIYTYKGAKDEAPLVKLPDGKAVMTVYSAEPVKDYMTGRLKKTRQRYRCDVRE